ncbi:hypothetical protein [Mesorhizobium sp. Mes31]|uniref:hypothetical protein n=1 Tax=Mesorhizobium sp. Mes31 TaxID=2926017 RepID=UPI002117947E|nr:hypothetical protein [Mesorhizobium sp. Mes31]
MPRVDVAQLGTRPTGKAAGGIGMSGLCKHLEAGDQDIRQAIDPICLSVLH